MGGRPDRIVAHFLTSAPTLKECPPPVVPEVAIAGRSNSGKSSVINQLTRNRQLPDPWWTVHVDESHLGHSGGNEFS